MSSYNAKKFSKDFSERTRKNLDYIVQTVHRRELEESINQHLLEAYEDIIDSLDTSSKEFLKKATNAPNHKVMCQKILRNTASHLQSERKQLEKALKEIDSSNEMRDQPLFEVTQLLNSLMGIAVLPYEMHKDYLNGDDIKKDVIQATSEYENLRSFIAKIYGRSDLYRSTYKDDQFRTTANWQTVISFLRHVRNTVCHAGDDALCILPLDNGTVIETIMFYDRNENSGEEFVMKLALEDVNRLVRYIAAFYSIPMIGGIDSSETIKRAKKLAEDFLNHRR